MKTSDFLAILGLGLLSILVSLLGYLGWELFTVDNVIAIESAHKNGALILVFCLFIAVSALLLSYACNLASRGK